MLRSDRVLETLRLALLLFLVPAVSGAATIDFGGGITMETGVEYYAMDHPDGSVRPPLYSLRLDGLDSDTSHEFTFSADDLCILISDTDELAIYGTLVGGLDQGDTRLDSAWSVDMTYNLVQDGTGSLPHLVAYNGTGTLTSLENANGFLENEEFDLVSYAGGHSYELAFDVGHRGVDDAVSVWGWLNHSGYDIEEHVYASDWLFKVGTPTPEPGTALLLGLGLTALGATSRKAQRAD